MSADLQSTSMEIRTLLNEEFKKNNLELKQLMAILFILGQAKTQEELISSVQLFSDSFPVLKNFSAPFVAENKKKLEHSIEIVVRRVIAQDPLKAAEIARAAMEEGANIEALQKQFPDVSFSS